MNRLGKASRVHSGEERRFIDLFAGCGGLSLGFVQAGWKGLFAIEKDEMAFKTFSANFLDEGSRYSFAWPKWISKAAHPIDTVLSDFEGELRKLRGTVDVVAGGPPCQGFSFAGRRVKDDPRNEMFRRYVRFVELVRPRVLVIENVLGMQIAHGAGSRKQKKRAGRPPSSYYDRLRRALYEIGYTAVGKMVDAAAYGVPQRRPRLIVIGVRDDLARVLDNNVSDVFACIENARVTQLEELGLDLPVSASDALSDLECHNGLIACRDPESPDGFLEPVYGGPVTHYQKLMHSDVTAMDSVRLARHRVEVESRFARILAECKRGVRLNDEARQKFGLLKKRIFPMDPLEPGPTVTTLPDDVLHYSEPRILSVRECARLQSFPDSFVFRGKYTTGGARRTQECPRYTQVGNAVPPLLARAVACGIDSALTLAGVASTARAS